MLERLTAKSKLLQATLPRAMRVDTLEEEVRQLKEDLSLVPSHYALEEEIKQLRDALAGEVFGEFSCLLGMCEVLIFFCRC